MRSIVKLLGYSVIALTILAGLIIATIAVGIGFTLAQGWLIIPMALLQFTAGFAMFVFGICCFRWWRELAAMEGR